MKRHFVSRAVLTVSLLATAGTAVIVPVAAHGATMAMTETWKGTVSKVNAMMGMTDSFQMTVGAKHYVVDYTSKVTFTMGMSSGIVAGAKVTVTGTLKGSTITATKLSI